MSLETTILSTPDCGTIQLILIPWDDAHPSGRPYHLVTTGRYFATPEEAQAYVNAHWNEPATIEYRGYAMAEASFGELP